MLLRISLIKLSTLALFSEFKAKLCKTVPSSLISCNNGFLKVTKVIFNKQELTSKEFINLIGEENLANQVLL